ncbi:hypothetical protein AVEN_199992-1 [Araneus ventricosus]|uniref:Uncharacterized protein n=1 Tax=Araneus ventricosus TaxID=182803 RepID=A0A4Y2BX38_ARAVE|nr:hypothetical protein AVEN_199992-1 [Araneus ventricosus]
MTTQLIICFSAKFLKRSGNESPSPNLIPSHAAEDLCLTATFRTHSQRRRQLIGLRGLQFLMTQISVYISQIKLRSNPSELSVWSGWIQEPSPPRRFRCGKIRSSRRLAGIY